MILCLETSASNCSVAIAHEGQLLALKESLTPNDHAASIIKHVDACLLAAQISLEDLEAVAISQGPGSFTGLRVGVSAAKGICFALDLPLIAISTLASLANAIFSEHNDLDFCIPMIEARKDEVFTAVFDRNLDMELSEQVVTLFCNWHHAIIDPQAKIAFVGSGSQKYGDMCQPDPLNLLEKPTSAKHLINLACAKHIKKDYCIVKKFTPNYLKLPHITQPRKVL
ncbi:MAG: tRNA (adenosine(37)-N6)-threonylcarbamoyltransferase complex dimerization subunit type 1 TsaB [Saprospiraceae bacterium]|nr:tRNA (adenosine(37)-N6)-threonylcarbamoyltransferase complex dimerization subunit type 1 TsaB [Saprospiraceae bacterium]